MIVHVHFWLMAQAIRHHCRQHGVLILSKDSRTERRVGFETDCPPTDPRFQAWSIQLAYLSETGNRRSDVDYEGYTDAQKRVMCRLLQTADGRIVLASILSGADPVGV